MQELTRKAALATGGNRGIDASVAERLAGRGAAVAITYAGADSVVTKATAAPNRRAPNWPPSRCLYAGEVVYPQILGQPRKENP
jgi:NAD(P)-dependent dehydrogenase (short-subunit alcohol dehydrogenase family)